MEFDDYKETLLTPEQEEQLAKDIPFKYDPKADLINGEQLLAEFDHVNDSSEPLIEGILYKESVVMFYADSGVGKSLITLSAMAQACSGNKVFGHYDVPRPLHVYWILGERSKHEPLSRLKLMADEMKNFNPNNFTLDTKIKGFNLLKESDQHSALDRIMETHLRHPIDVIVLDPIYSLVAGGLSEDKPANAFVRFSNLIQNATGAANVLIHHTNRGQRDQSGVRQSGDMYGSRWLDAHISGSFHIKSNEEQATLTKMKDNHGNLVKDITLVYDPMTHLCYNVDGTSVSSIDRLKVWLRDQKRLNKMFDFKEMKDAIQVSTSQMRKIMSTHQNSLVEIVASGCKNKKLYKSVI